jgi:hypothetical protein
MKCSSVSVVTSVGPDHYKDVKVEIKAGFISLKKGERTFCYPVCNVILLLFVEELEQHD